MGRGGQGNWECGRGGQQKEKKNPYREGQCRKTAAAVAAAAAMTSRYDQRDVWDKEEEEE